MSLTSGNRLLLIVIVISLSCLIGCDDEPTASQGAGTQDAGTQDAGTQDAGAQEGEAGAGTQAGEAGTQTGEGGYMDDGSPSEGLGLYQVGYQSLEFSYTLPEALAQSLGESLGETVSARALRLALWYPTEATEGERVVYPLLTRREGPLLDAPPASLNGQAPVLLYSHGAKVWPELGAFMHEFFASHGWVVVAVEHDHDHIQSVTRPRPNSMYLLRPRDVSEALSYVIDLKRDGAHPVASLIDERFVLASGHSFGGYTSYALAGARYATGWLSAECATLSDTFCEDLARLTPMFEQGARDERVTLVAPQSSGNLQMFAEGVRAVELPVLHTSALLDQDCTEEAQNAPYWEELLASGSREHRWLSLKRAGHASLTVSCEQFPALEQDNGCGPDFTDPVTLQALTNHYTLSFARAHFAGDEPSLATLAQGREDDEHRLSLP